MKSKFLLHNFYLKQPLKFVLKYSFIDKSLRAVAELMKLVLINSGLMKPVFNERLFERPFVFANLPRKERVRVLDLGCGDSILPLELKSLGYETWGSDPKDHPFKNKFKFVQGDFVKMKDKFPENYFDVVTCVSAIEHFGLEPVLGEKLADFDLNRKDIEAIRICKNILKKKGLLILTTPYGKKKLFDVERVYDESEIEKLTKGFRLLEKKLVDIPNSLATESAPHPKIFMGVFEKI